MIANLLLSTRRGVRQINAQLLSPNSLSPK